MCVCVCVHARHHLIGCVRMQTLAEEGSPVIQFQTELSLIKQPRGGYKVPWI